LTFEPLSESFEIMRANIYLNGLNGLITPYNLALGDGTDISFNMGGYMINYSKDSSKKIKTERLDNFNFNNISLIKIDVEGFELYVLRGAIETIKKNKPRIIIETQSKELRIRTNEILSSVGYSLSYRDKSRCGDGFMDEVTNLFYRCLQIVILTLKLYNEKHKRFGNFL
jgi:methyltransferase, FkbM family